MFQNVQQGGKDKRCCWVCVPCPAGEILMVGGESCEKCPEGYAPNADKTGIDFLILLATLTFKPKSI